MSHTPSSPTGFQATEHLWLLSDNGKQFTPRLFTHVCELVGTTNPYTTTYHPQPNGQVERFNRTLLNALRHYVLHHPKDWNLFYELLTYAYNCQIHTRTKAMPFGRVISRPPQPLALSKRTSFEYDAVPQLCISTRWLNDLKEMAQKTTESMRRAQKYCKEHFDRRLNRSNALFANGEYLFSRQEHHLKAEGTIALKETQVMSRGQRTVRRDRAQPRDGHCKETRQKIR